MAKEKTVTFNATKTAKVPTVVSFRTKDGSIVSFDATKTIKVKAQVSFKAERRK